MYFAITTWIFQVFCTAWIFSNSAWDANKNKLQIMGLVPVFLDLTFDS